MSKIVEANERGVPQAAPKKEFYVYADDSGIAEIRHTNDVEYSLQVLMGIANFIRANLRNQLTGQPPSLPEFLRDMADIAERSAMLVVSPEESTGEAAVEPAPQPPLDLHNKETLQ
jgi:hypothetical protein